MELSLQGTFYRQSFAQSHTCRDELMAKNRTAVWLAELGVRVSGCIWSSSYWICFNSMPIMQNLWPFNITCFYFAITFNALIQRACTVHIFATRKLKQVFKPVAILVKPKHFKRKGLIHDPQSQQACLQWYKSCQRAELNHWETEKWHFYKDIFLVYSLWGRGCECQMLITQHQWVCKVTRWGKNEG